MIDRRAHALRRLRMFVAGQAAFYLFLLLFIAATYGGGRGGWTFAVATFAFVLLNGLLLLTYPLWGQALDYPIGSILSGLRAEGDEDRFALHLRDAHAHLDAARRGLAYRALQAASALQPENTEVLFELAELCQRDGKKAAAARYFTRILELGALHSPTRRLTESRERLAALDAERP